MSQWVSLQVITPGPYGCTTNPLLACAVLVFFLGRGLSKDPRYVPSPLVGKPAPTFNLPQLHDPKQTFAPEDLKGRVWLLNVWASWCVSCRAEHPVLIDFARTHPDIPLIGLDYKDQRPDALAWLKQHGNPYVLSAFDAVAEGGVLERGQALIVEHGEDRK